MKNLGMCTFCICNHPWDDSITQISAFAEAEGYHLATPLIGEIVDYEYIAAFSKKWWEEVQ